MKKWRRQVLRRKKETFSFYAVTAALSSLAIPAYISARNNIRDASGYEVAGFGFAIIGVFLTIAYTLLLIIDEGNHE